MEILKELTYIVTRNKLKTIELLGTENSNKSKILALYEGIAKGKFESDEVAIEALFSEKNFPAYNKLKFHLRKRLINSVFFLDSKKSSYTNRQQAYYECYKEWAAVRILLGKNAWKSSLYISKKILKHAIKYEFTEMVLDLARVLRLNYGTRQNDFKNFLEYKLLYETYEKLYLIENRAELLYTELIVEYNKKSKKENLHQQALNAYNDLEQSLKDHNSYRLHLYAGMIRIMISSFVDDYQNTLKACEHMIQHFLNKPYQANTPLLIAYYQELACYCQMGMFEKGQQAAENCLKLIDEGSVNWFKYYELYFILAMYTDQYEKALQLHRKVTSHKRFSFLHSSVKEIWTIYEAYLHYLYEIGLLKDVRNRFSKFKLGRFLNSTPIYSKDKQGMNVSILIIQIVFLIWQKKYGKVFDKLEAVKKYNNRYLRSESTIRSYYFIKMLTKVPMGNFHKQAVVRKTEGVYQQLKATSLKSVNQVQKIEIIPYEKLWSFIIDNLDNAIYKMKMS